MTERFFGRWGPGLAAAMVFGLLGGLSPGLRAQEAETEAVTVAEADAEEGAADGGLAALLGGTYIQYRNVASGYSFDKGAELTYNPYYAMAVEYHLRFKFLEVLWAGLDFDHVTELTNADDTTQYRETMAGDLLLRVGASKMWMFGIVGVGVGGDLTVQTPTSKVSQMRTMQVGLRPGANVSLRVDVLAGITLTYALQLTGYVYDSTSGRQLEDKHTFEGDKPRTGQLSDLDSFNMMGGRNTQWRLTNLLSLTVDFTDWVGFAGVFGVVTDYLFPLSDMPAGEQAISDQPMEDTDERWMMVYGLELYFQPIPALGLALGTSTINPQLAPNSTPYPAFFNRYTTYYFDIRFNVAGLISQLTSNGGM